MTSLGKPIRQIEAPAPVKETAPAEAPAPVPTKEPEKVGA